MLTTAKLTLTVLALTCVHAYAQTPTRLFADIPVRVRLAQVISPETLQLGHYIYFHSADAVCIGNSVAIPEGADVIAEVASLDKSWLGKIAAIKIRFLYIRTPSGDQVPLYRGRYLETDWKVPLVRGSIRMGTQATVFVSRDFTLRAAVTNDSTPPRAADHAPVRWSASR